MKLWKEISDPPEFQRFPDLRIKRSVSAGAIQRTVFVTHPSGELSLSQSRITNPRLYVFSDQHGRTS